MKQLVKITPIEPYTFGTDQKFQYPNQKLTGKESYFVNSRTVPEQTTILGMLRLLILKQKGLFRSDFHYTEEQRKQMRECIGPCSFRFGERKQDFGCIHSISPVFLMDKEGNYYVKNPFHNIEQKKGYKPMALSEKRVETSFGNIRLPKKEAYHAKEGHARGYYNLKTGDICNNLFSSMIVPGNRKNSKLSDEDCFFKKELIVLKKGYCFAVFVDAEELFQAGMVSMGLGGCMFSLTSEPNREDDLEKCVTEAFAGNKENKEIWFYALSDLAVRGLWQQMESLDGSFYIVEQKQMRNLETVYKEQIRLQKLRLSKNQMNMIQSGSVFFERCGLDLEDENCKQIGYNRIVRLGG